MTARVLGLLSKAQTLTCNFTFHFFLFTFHFLSCTLMACRTDGLHP